MRVNIYAEEMTDRVEIISKEIDGHTFTGLRLYLELPVTVGAHREEVERKTADEPVREIRRHRVVEGPPIHEDPRGGASQVAGPFRHRPGDDDSAAVTFWGKRDLRDVLRKMLAELDAHYAARETRGADGL